VARELCDVLRTAPRSPVIQCTVAEPSYGQTRCGIGKPTCHLFVDINPNARGVINGQVTSVEPIVHFEYVVHNRLVGHVLLNAKIVDGKVEMNGSRQSDGREVRGPVKARSNMINVGKCRDLLQVGDAPAMTERHPHVVDELLGNQGRAVVNRVENFTNG